MCATTVWALTVSTDYEGCVLEGVYLDPASARSDFEGLVRAHCAATGQAPVDPAVADDGELSVVVADQSFILSPMVAPGAPTTVGRVWALTVSTDYEGSELRAIYLDPASARSDFEGLVRAHCAATGQAPVDPAVADDGELSVVVADQSFALSPVAVGGRLALV